MADYAFSIVGLISPTQPAYIQAYRPALAVLNTGTKPLTLGGTFSVYERQAPGRLLFQTGWIAATVASGDSVQLLGATYWTPPATGDYTVAAHVTSNRPNLFHDFGPLALHVSGGEPPEPPVVTAHATQHEIGGGDQVNVTNLRGELYDPQPPKDHASRHEQGGADEMSVNQLHGTLADPQPTANHGNESHTPAFVDVMVLEEALDNHNAAPTAHDAATNLEQTARKDQPGGYAGLDIASLVKTSVLAPIPVGGGNADYLAYDRTWKPSPVVLAGTTHRLTADYDDIELSSGQSVDALSGTIEANTLTDLSKVAIEMALTWLGGPLSLTVRVLARQGALPEFSLCELTTSNPDPNRLSGLYRFSAGLQELAPTVLRFLNDAELISSPIAGASLAWRDTGPGGGAVIDPTLPLSIRVEVSAPAAPPGQEAYIAERDIYVSYGL
jgi:hypothetical protein